MILFLFLATLALCVLAAVLRMNFITKYFCQNQFICILVFFFEVGKGGNKKKKLENNKSNSRIYSSSIYNQEDEIDRHFRNLNNKENGVSVLSPEQKLQFLEYERMVSEIPATIKIKGLEGGYDAAPLPVIPNISNLYKTHLATEKSLDFIEHERMDSKILPIISTENEKTTSSHNNAAPPPMIPSISDTNKPHYVHEKSFKMIEYERMASEIPATIQINSLEGHDDAPLPVLPNISKINTAKK